VGKCILPLAGNASELNLGVLERDSEVLGEQRKPGGKRPLKKVGVLSARAPRNRKNRLPTDCGGRSTGKRLGNNDKTKMEWNTAVVLSQCAQTESHGVLTFY